MRGAGHGVRERIRLRGFVQGVGFRPHVYNLANSLSLSGFVINTPEGVEIEVEGDRGTVDRFFSLLVAKAPPQASISGSRRQEIPERGGSGFVIMASRQGDAPARALVSPDLALCPACLAEMNDPADRRHRYPFINCTNCGPRFTIISDLPYDRPATTMAPFTMCEACRREYEDPADRRFHAQPNACPDCGPAVELVGADGVCLSRGDQAVRETADALARGRIVAVKGIGGFHLAVNGRDPVAVAELRRRKRRPVKPFALMARDVAAAASIAEISPAARQALVSWRAPIVLVPRLSAGLPCEEIAPGIASLGIMLPYTPLHHLIFGDLLDLLVMTSGNIAGEPIITENSQALRDLAGIADLFLLHDREILTGADDSVEIEQQGAIIPLRRSRGHVLRGIPLAGNGPAVLGVGGELKNTICLLRDDFAFPGQHIGDLKSAAALKSFRASIEYLEKILAVRPEAVACDLHPDYLSSRWAEDESGLPLVRVQHHHAHLAACLAENQETDPAVAIILDGTGLGKDHSVWGGEILFGDLADSVRKGGLSPLRLAGGDRAVKEPWRTAVAYLHQAGGLDLLPAALADMEGYDTVCRAVDAGLNAPWCSSCGRLFDAVAAMAGLCLFATFDGEGPMRLEAICESGGSDYYPVTINKEEGRFVINSAELLLAVAGDLARGIDAAEVSGRFHRGLARGLSMAAVEVCRETGTGTVALSGGVFANRIMAGEINRILADFGLKIINHRRLPPGDGCLATGQAVAARCRLQGGLSVGL